MDGWMDGCVVPINAKQTYLTHFFYSNGSVVHSFVSSGRVEEFMAHIEHFKRENAAWRERAMQYRGRCKAANARLRYGEDEAMKLRVLLHKVGETSRARVHVCACVTACARDVDWLGGC